MNYFQKANPVEQSALEKDASTLLHSIQLSEYCKWKDNQQATFILRLKEQVNKWQHFIATFAKR